MPLRITPHSEVVTAPAPNRELFTTTFLCSRLSPAAPPLLPSVVLASSPLLLQNQETSYLRVFAFSVPFAWKTLPTTTSPGPHGGFLSPSCLYCSLTFAVRPGLASLFDTAPLLTHPPVFWHALLFPYQLSPLNKLTLFLSFPSQNENLLGAGSFWYLVPNI